MKVLIYIARVWVGLLFIFSGLVKANDPLGLSYKMQEFFEVWNFHAFDHFALAFSVIMIVFEIVAGIAILLGWQTQLFVWLLLLLIIFFTFLTGYAYLSGNIRECGCFGDCIPLTAGQSFAKDLILLGLIIFLFTQWKKIKPVFPSTASISILILSTIVAFSFQWWVLQHLPLVDCLPYKIGANIEEKSKPPAGAIPDSTVINFVYEKKGKQVEFSSSSFPADFDDSYKFIKRYDRLARKGNAEAPIKDFVLITETGTDTTSLLLDQKGYLFLLFAKELPQVNPAWDKTFSIILSFLKSKSIPICLITASEQQATDYVKANNLDSILVILKCDATAIKTAARANPTLYLLKKGTIVDKWSYADFEASLETINSLPNQLVKQ